MGKKWIMGLEVEDIFDININSVAQQEVVEPPQVQVQVQAPSEEVVTLAAVDSAVLAEEKPAELPAEKVSKSKKKAVTTDVE